MTPKQFELFKAQLSRLTPQQLQTLQGEIRQNNKTRNQKQSPSVLLTEEEVNAISSLFA
ncbi:hypothetical protein [Vibrio marisflavi]|uniref:Uncharacterized protein n=1 Tax=Vibrio marisflavi CECT 7928 TaxID=634439 RepID=A0ABN8E1Q0_9VIBR|nr:hypothetical protein [Vibrio marisflavi]CAH0536734.1 hypothetical protein VMF7928_00653 [Vibrio marisflavi CECT 7928]